MDILAPYYSTIQFVAWKVFLFGMVWQFLRWFLLTRWVVKTAEHWIGYAIKIIIEQLLQCLTFAGSFLLQNSKSILVEIWKYRMGKILLSILVLYLVYLIIYSL